MIVFRDCLFEFFDSQVMDETFANDKTLQPGPPAHHVLGRL